MSGSNQHERVIATKLAAVVERRSEPERRLGIDRRGGDAVPAEGGGGTTGPRAYAFRSFDERRCNQDRRLYGIDCGRLSPVDDTPPNDVLADAVSADDAAAAVTPEAAVAAQAAAAVEAVDAVELPPGFGIVALSDDDLRALLLRCDH